VGKARRGKPDLLVGWMYHGNVAASLVRPFLPKVGGRKVPVVWNVRHSADDMKQEKRLTAALIRGGKWWAPGTARIVFNSHHSARRHQSFGYPEEKTAVVPNGFDCELFRPRPEARQWLRGELGVPEETRLVGRVGRLHPVKDYPGFLEAAGRLESSLHWVLVGSGLSPENTELADLIRRHGLEERCHLLGERSDLPQIVAGLDLSCSSSLSEGFPNVVAEAMACGVPCVATDVGASAEIVGETGRIVPPGEPASMAEALDELLRLSREERALLGAAARERIQERYSADVVNPLHLEIWNSCLGGAAGNTGS